MTNYDNTNRGSIWGNDRKEKDTQPDFKGSLNVEGTEYWVSAWKRKPDANPKAPALSFSITQKDEQPQQQSQGFRDTPPAQPKPAPVQQEGFEDDDIPF